MTLDEESSFTRAGSVRLTPPTNAFQYLGVHELANLNLGNSGALRNQSVIAATENLLREIPLADQAIRSVTKLFTKRVRQRSEVLDALRSSGHATNMPLFGVPVLVKENIAVENESLQCASRILEGYVSPYSATVVQRIERAGGIVLGSTNMDEFAMGSSCEHSCHGPTRNPYDLECVPGGSSGGGAAAAAMGFVPVSLGSDTGGSVRQPASFCNVFGFKPTYGVVSRYGLVAFGSSLDQISPFTRTVPDLIEIMSVIAGCDPLDPTTLADDLDFSALRAKARQPERHFSQSQIKSRNKVLEGAESKNLRVGVPWKLIEACCAKDVVAAFKDFVARIEACGVSAHAIEIPDLAVALPAYYVLSSAEASSNLARFDGLKYGRRSSGVPGDQVVRSSRSSGFGKEVKRRICLGSFVLSSGYYEAYYGKALLIRSLLANRFDELFRNFDFILTPTTPTTAFRLGENMSDPVQMYAGDVLTIPPSLVGLPALSVPVACGGQRSLGIQILGAKKSDVDLLDFALELEMRKICGIDSL